MNDFEKKIRNKLLMRGFKEHRLTNNRGLIGATIDEVILEVVKNIGVTRCCETFEGKEVPTFEEWKKANYIHYDKGLFTRRAEGLKDLDQLIAKYDKDILNF